MRSLTYVDIKYMRFCLCQWKWVTDFIFHKANFENIIMSSPLLLPNQRKVIHPPPSLSLGFELWCTSVKWLEQTNIITSRWFSSAQRSFIRSFQVHNTLLQLWCLAELVWNLNQNVVDITQTKWIEKIH